MIQVHSSFSQTFTAQVCFDGMVHSNKIQHCQSAVFTKACWQILLQWLLPYQQCHLIASVVLIGTTLNEGEIRTKSQWCTGLPIPSFKSLCSPVPDSHLSSNQREHHQQFLLVHFVYCSSMPTRDPSLPQQLAFRIVCLAVSYQHQLWTTLACCLCGYPKTLM